MHELKPEWFVQNGTLRLSIQHFKRNETSSGYSGGSHNWSYHIVDGDLASAYNFIVDAAKKTFHLPDMKKMKVAPKVDRQQPSIVNRNPEKENYIVNTLIIFLAVGIGAFIGSVFF